MAGNISMKFALNKKKTNHIFRSGFNPNISGWDHLGKGDLFLFITIGQIKKNLKTDDQHSDVLEPQYLTSYNNFR